MFALTDHAFSLAEKDKEPGWLIWIDVDSYATKRLTQKDLENILSDNVDIVHTGNHSFIAFNLNKKPPLDLLWDLRRTYMNGEVIQYREWTDSFILERLLNIYKAHGLKIKDVRDIIGKIIVLILLLEVEFFQLQQHLNYMYNILLI